MHDVSKDVVRSGKLRPEEQVKRTILCNGCEGRKVYLDVRVCACVCKLAVRRKEGRLVGELAGSFSSLCWASPTRPPAKIVDRYKPCCVPAHFREVC